MLAPVCDATFSRWDLYEISSVLCCPFYIWPIVSAEMVSASGLIFNLTGKDFCLFWKSLLTILLTVLTFIIMALSVFLCHAFRNFLIIHSYSWSRETQIECASIVLPIGFRGIFALSLSLSLSLDAGITV